MDKKFILMALLFLAVVGVIFIFYKSKELKRVYQAEVKKELTKPVQSGDILTEEDIKNLPEPVQKYLRYTNSVGREKVRNFRVEFDGQFKTGPKSGWARMNALQFTNLEDTTRLYYLEMKMLSLPVTGLHKYSNAAATMIVKLAGIIKVADGRGREMNEGETVTVFNDMCLLAPASLIDKRISWETINRNAVKATFNNKGIKVSAILSFNDKGELINFVSDDRYYSPTGATYEKYRWSTPVYDYKDYNGVRISSGGEAVWFFPEVYYCYAKANIKNIEYNVKE